MQGKWPRPAERARSLPFCEIQGSIGWSFFFVVRIVQPGPMFLFFVPPDQFLTLAPGLAVGPRRRPVVNDAAIIRPRESPSMTKKVFGFSLVSPVATFLRKYAAIDPRSARGGSIFLEILDVLQQFAIRQRIAIDLLQDLRNFGLGMVAFGRVIPGERLESIVA